MAAEDSGNNSAPAPASNPILPRYPELILAAIEALDSKKGANKSRISNQIQASYGSVPAAHKTLLSHHLNKMRASGELALIKNNYVKRDPNSPPPRGRGRPSKPKEPVPEGTFISPSRPRGRPRKSLEPFNPISAPSVSGRKRGRPRKTGMVVAAPSVSGRKRGRPRKTETVVAPTPTPSIGEEKGRGPPRMVLTDGDSTLPPSGEKKGRGRPRKVKTDADLTLLPSTGERRGRGRPRKVEAAPALELF
ncbi:hypothetical protein L1987_06615 [Smallanthus sonchifolius]|uniref:Uncharacterized protein n=1 Tax=Smallanthus sonchifolius TaxID=185202 RepID=A0ACB9JZ05_9ASTR|nr:hypothetical protein L1987_06615 [Smallanthus sonchifolius]